MIRKSWGYFLLVSLLISPVHAQSEVDYFVQATVDNPAPFVGEQIVYSFQIFSSVSTPALPEYQPPDFEGFWSAGSIPDDSYAQGSYVVTVRDTILFPTQVGDLVLEPAQLTFPPSAYRDEQILQSDAVTINVRPLPPGAPTDFSGGVGTFELFASLSRSSVAFGDPFTLQLTVIGTGNVEQLPEPVLPVSDDWRVYTQPTIYTEESVEGGLLIGRKRFEWLVIPGAVGSQTLPSISISYFDPVDMIYHTISTDPVSIEVLAAEDVILPDISDLIAEDAERWALKPVPSTLVSASDWPGVGFWVLWILPPLAFFAGGWWVWFQKRLELQRVDLRRKQALRTARSNLAGAARLRGDEAYKQLIAAVLTYFGDKWNREPLALNQADLIATLRSQNVDEGVVEAMIKCMDMAEEGRYAPHESASPAPLAKRTLAILTTVDAALES